MYWIQHRSVTLPVGRWLSAIILLSGCMVCTVQPAHAAELKAVQSGTATIADGNSSVTVNITAVDGSKAFLVFSMRIENNNPEDSQLSGQITNCTTTCDELTFARVDMNDPATVQWYVAEFTSGVTVQRGSVELNEDPEDVTLSSSVTLGKSFPIISFQKAGSGYDGDDFVRAKFTDSTTLRLETDGLFDD